MAMNDVLRQAREGKINPVYICFGTERFLLDTFVTQLADYVVEREQQEFALNQYDLSDVSIDDVLDDAETLPFFAPRKIIIAKNAYFLTNAKGPKTAVAEGQVHHHIERLISYVQSPAQFSTLVLIVEEPKLDERRKIVKALRQFATVLQFKPLTGAQLVSWVTAQFAAQQCQISREAVHMLLQSVGSNMQLLASEIHKLALFAGNEGEVTTEIVENLAVRSLEQNIFRLIDHIVDRRAADALQILDDMLQQREDPITILLLIARQYRIVLQVQHLHQQGLPVQQIAAQANIKPFLIKGALAQSKRYKESTLRGILAHLAKLEYEMKMGLIDKVRALELFILRLA